MCNLLWCQAHADSNNVIIKTWASSWDYGTYHKGDQWRLRRAWASAQSPQSRRCLHTWSLKADEAQRATIAHLSQMCHGQISFKKTYKWAMKTRGPKLNSSELLCLSWFPATLMMIQSKMIELAWSHHFPRYKSMGNFFRPQGQLIP